MKKTLLVSAVAMAVSGNAMAAEMYGNIRLELRTSDYLDQATTVDELDVASGKLVLGSKGSSDLGNGMTVSYGVELEHDQADATGGVTDVDFDKSWVALAGNWGKVTAGRKGDLAGYACSGTDLLTHGSAEACSLGHNTEFDDAIMYTGAAGGFEFGYIFTADGTTADDDSAYGAKFSGENWSVGAQFWDRNIGATSVTPSQIGGTLQLGNFGLGVTVGDSDLPIADTGGVDLGLYMPLGSGNLAVVVSTMDADNSDSADVDWSNSLGESAYWGIEWNSHDQAEEDRIIGYFGTNF